MKWLEKQKKKSNGPDIKPVSWQNKSRPTSFRALIACANEAVVTDLRNYRNNKTKWNKRFLLFLVEQKVSRGKLSFFAYVISGEQSTNPPRQLRNDAFHVKPSQSVKNYLDRAKKPTKNRYTPLLHEGIQFISFPKLNRGIPVAGKICSQVKPVIKLG